MPLNRPITNWQGKRVWIIGASTGIGLALAHCLVEAGAELALSSRSFEKLQNALEILSTQTLRPKPLAIALDITDAAALQLGALNLIQTWGTLDVVVIMAGTYVEMHAQTFNLPAARQQMEVNINGVLNVLNAVLPQLIKQASGHLCIVSSVAGYSGLPKGLVYGASKAAVINLTESLYLDLKSQGVDVSLVCPGFVDTALTANNQFRMPCLITAQQAAQAMMRSFARGDFEMHFPKRFSYVLKFLRLLPHRAYFFIIQKLTGVK